jgi:hypothetical protein
MKTNAAARLPKMTTKLKATRYDMAGLSRE